MRWTIPTLVIAACAATPAGAVAQGGLVPSGTGFSIAGALSVHHSNATGSGLDGTSSKPSGEIEIAYGATPRIALLGAFRPVLAAAGTQNYTVNSAEFGLRYLGKAGMQLRPFAEGGLAIRSLRYELTETYTSSNVGPWASIGAMRLGSGHWSFEAAATWKQGRFDNWKRNSQAIIAEPTTWSAVGGRIGARYWVRAR